MARPDHRLGVALACHQRGQTTQARQLYEDVLRDQPGHPDALHLLGVLKFQLGDAAAARQDIERAIRQRPDFPDAQFNLAKVMTALGRHGAAADAYRAVIRRQPDKLDAHYNLAQALAAGGDFAGAVASYRRALEIDPKAAQVWSMLGNAQRQLGDREQAVAAYRRAIELDPRNPIPHNNLSVALREVGQLAAAAEAARCAVARRADFADGHLNLGTALADQGDLAGAIGAYRRGLEIAPDNPLLHDNFAMVLRDAGDLDAAEAASRRSLALQPDSATALANLGTTLRAGGRLAEAGAVFDRAVALDPSSTAARLGCATVLIDRGRLAAAEKVIRAALESDPTSTEAYFALAEVADLEPGDPATAAIESGLQISQLSAGQAVRLHYALAKMYHQLGQYDQAFGHYAAGARRKRETMTYDVDADIARMRQIEEVFDGAVMANGGGDPSPAPIFIVGMPRSGSTLVEQILASHSDVAGGGELPIMLRLIDKLDAGSNRYPAAVRDLTSADFTRLGHAVADDLRTAAHGRRRVVDKLLSNFQNVGLIRRILPNAKIIWCRRSPLDTGLSCFRTLFRRGLSFTYDLNELGRYFRAHDQLMRHWLDMAPDALYPVDYERLIARPEDQIRDLLQACGLAWQPQCLAFHETERVVFTASAVQVRRPIHRKAAGQWRHYAAHLGPLADALGPLADTAGSGVDPTD